MQFQSDVLGSVINRPACIESTALGAAYLAGLATGFFDSMESIKSGKAISRRFIPVMPEELAKERIDGWHDAVERTLSYKN